MRVFVSSTVFDLIDVRAELAQQLRELGIDAVLSDDKLSEFRVAPDSSSIETCLANVASCDEFLIVLDRRYGPRLGPSGFENVSATHLEYRHAVKCAKPIRFFVRDRLEADHVVWKRNKKNPDLKLPWVSEGNIGLFDLMEEHKKLEAGSRSNWCYTFNSSVDLKAAVAKGFESRLLPERLVDAIESNQFPIIDIKTEVTHEQIGVLPGIKLSTEVVNVGGAPAFNCRIEWEGGSEAEHPKKSVLAPMQSIHMSYLYCPRIGQDSTEQVLVVEYESPLGVAVKDRFHVGATITRNVLIGGGSLIERKYRRTSEVTIQLDD